MEASKPEALNRTLVELKYPTVDVFQVLDNS